MVRAHKSPEPATRRMLSERRGQHAEMTETAMAPDLPDELAGTYETGGSRSPGRPEGSA